MSNDAQATWGGRFSSTPAELMQRFSESISFDQKLAVFDIACSRAHSAMLKHVGLISEAEMMAIHVGLDQILEEVQDGRLQWRLELEDVHMNIEHTLAQRVPAAAKLHTARSRNDQVATDMRLYFKYANRELQMAILDAITTLLEVADANKHLYIPGYTHLQRAQPVSVAHHLLAWVEMLGRDWQRFEHALEQANACPLGSGAIAGTTLPIDRQFSAQRLGFVDDKGNARLTRNSMDAVADRDAFNDFAYACATLAVHLSRIAEDVILWNSTEFGFVRLPDAFTTGSSLMPQKKNPDSFELIRGKSARIISQLQMLLMLQKGLPLTYNRDLQEDKPPVFDAHAQSLLCLQVLSGCLQGIQFNENKCHQAVADPLLLATDLADFLVMKNIPFREAHHLVGRLVGVAEKLEKPLNTLTDEEAFAVDERLGADWRQVFDLKRAMDMREKEGMPGSAQIQKQMAYWNDWKKDKHVIM
jgi:argininosuccinate lyase